MMEEGEEGESQNPNVTVRHIKKRALRNKGLSVSFNDKNLRDFVTGFHKRKKKRRLEAKRQLEEKERLKRIERRKQRKLEREFVLFGGVVPAENAPDTGSGGDDYASGDAEGDHEQTSSLSDGKVYMADSQSKSWVATSCCRPGNSAVSLRTKLYDNGDTTITVTTSEIWREGEDRQVSVPSSAGEAGMKRGSTSVTKHSATVAKPVKKKPFKRVAQSKSRKKPKRSAPQSKGKRSRRKP